MKKRRISTKKPLLSIGWKPKPKWIVTLKRGSGSEGNRMTRGCDSLEDGRNIAEQYFKSGWDEAWVIEKL